MVRTAAVLAAALALAATARAERTHPQLDRVAGVPVLCVEPGDRWYGAFATYGAFTDTHTIWLLDEDCDRLMLLANGREPRSPKAAREVWTALYTFGHEIAHVRAHAAGIKYASSHDEEWHAFCQAWADWRPNARALGVRARYAAWLFGAYGYDNTNAQWCPKKFGLRPRP